ncbi:50S ribosomal protein L27 [Ischnura elegans]|uniref:50S ribosomal protein L27 n=1 Tax=Ischnura elegans TaxID=197161 RepID=UPI001ED86989|nr:50S ribosomal protein L27 [Ischnura elegans]
MSGLLNFSVFTSLSRPALLYASSSIIGVRFASKKTSGSTRYQKTKGKPKHRGWRVQDGATVTAGTILATQNRLRFHPGLNVGLGRNGTLFAMEPGEVLITCEKFDPKWDHTWVQRLYAGREHETIYKKYFNVVPEKQHNRFKLVDRI